LLNQKRVLKREGGRSGERKVPQLGGRIPYNYWSQIGIQETSGEKEVKREIARKNLLGKMVVRTGE